MRKTATAEQKQAAAERRERFKALCQRVAEMTEDERAQLVARCGAIVTPEGRALSVHNSCLILHQLPSASMVGGFQQWLKVGRVVRKGERGLSLWFPRSGSANSEAQAAPEGEQAENDSQAGEKPRFAMGTVFDVSQTEPKTDKPAE